jgi:formylglycine-generating enzyme required for sulfatase activity
MKRHLPLALLMLCALALPTDLSAGGGGAGNKALAVVRIKNTFPGSTSTPLVVLDTVEIADPGNAGMTLDGASLGAVAQSFRMAKHEISIAHYVTFLNATAQRGDGANGAIIESLYDPRMASDLTVAGISRTGAGSEASPYIYEAVGDPLKPIAHVTWFNAARFANWLHNGAAAGSDTENGAYTLNGATSGIISKNPTATWWIPSQDEWFKAAYYKGNGTTAGYWRYPTQSDDFPRNSSSADSNNANFLRLGLFSVTQSSTLDTARNYLSAVGTFVNSPSAYGTFDQGGNLDEWTDGAKTTGFGIERITRGGAWNSGGLNNDATPSSTAFPSDRSSKIGFRLARTTGPDSSGALSGTFMVKAGATEVSLRRIAPNEVTQFAIRQGSFTVETQDANNPNLRTAKDFSTGNKRTTLITVSAVDGVIILQEAGADATF